MKQPTMRSIAELAEVSVSTVSRYLRDGLSLKPETERRIKNAMRSVGYEPPQPSVKQSEFRGPNHRRVVGLVIPNSADEYFGAIMDELGKASASYDLDVLVASALDSPVHHTKCMQLLASGIASGIITSGQKLNPETLRSITAKGIPILVFDDKFREDHTLDCVRCDDYSGAYQATAHLVHSGHRRIAFIGGLTELFSTQERLRGWRDALLWAGINPDEQITMSGEFSEQYGQAVFPHLVERPDPPTGVFAASDRIAIGIMMAARRQQISIPEKLSLIGFDDLPASSFVSPRLTTVRTPISSMAKSAMRLMVERLADPDRPASDIIVPVALVPGETVARLELQDV